MATATISKSKVTKKYTGAADNITITGSSNEISTMGGNDKVTLSKGNSNTIDAGTGNDTIIVNKGNRHNLRGGKGSDTYIINSKIAKSTRLTINQSDYRKNDTDILRLSKVNMMDMSYSLENGTLTMTHKNGGKITVPGWDKNPLSKIEFANHQATPFMDWSITGKQINNYLALASGNVINVTQKGTYKCTKSKDLFRFKGFGWTATVKGADKSDALDLSWYYEGLDHAGVEQKGNDLCFKVVKEGSGSESRRTATIKIKDYFTSKSKLGKIGIYWSADAGRWASGFSRGMLCVVNFKYGKSGTSGDDWIIATKTGTYKGGAGNDMIGGSAGNSKLYGGAGDDSISGGAGNERLYGGAGNDEMDGNEGDDKLWGGAGNDWMCDHEGKNELYGEAGNDVLEVSGIADQMVSGGEGSDSYYIDYVQSGANITIDQSGYSKGDKDVLHLAYMNKEDVSYSYSTDNNDTLILSRNYSGKITVKGWDMNPLSKIVFADGTELTGEEINAHASPSNSAVEITQQSVIKNFMKSLDENTTLITATVGNNATEEEINAALDAARNDATAALSTAVNYASNGHFATWDALIESFVSDVRNYAVKDDPSADDCTYGNTDAYGHVITYIPESGLDRFLKNYCAIDLTNEDTGSIIGADAGGAEVKTAVSIVPENGTVAELRSPGTDPTTTLNGLTFHWPDVGGDATKQYIINSLYTWWAEEGLNLVDEAFGLSFTEEGVTGRDMTVEFVEKDENFLAKVESSYDYRCTFSGNEKEITSETTALNMQINMKYFNSVDTNSVDGYVREFNSYLDRTIAHEFTHAIMGSTMERVYAGGCLPKSVTEGLAELIHGIDDTRATDIIWLAKSDNADSLYQILQPDEVGNLTYAAGYMLFRYLAKQVADAFHGQSGNESPGMIATTAADVASGFASTSSSMLAGNAMTVSDCSESSLTIASIQNAILDFADTRVSDSMAGVQQEDKNNNSIFITGNI